MAYNKKSLENLKPFKKDDNRPSEAGKKGGKSRQKQAIQKKTMSEVIKAALDTKLNDETIKELKKIYPDLDESHFTTRFRLYLSLVDIAVKGERDGDRINAVNTIMAYAGETPELALIKQAEELRKTQYEDDPFSKSIKERLKK